MEAAEDETSPAVGEKRPAPESEQGQGEPKARRITGLGVRRLARGSLIATSDGSVITAIGLPTRKKRIQGFDIEEDGGAKKRKGTETRDEFMAKESHVAVTNTPITVSRADGSVRVDRLNTNVTVLKAPREEAQEETEQADATAQPAEGEEEKQMEEPSSMEEAKEIHEEEGEAVKDLSGEQSEQPPKENDADSSLVQDGPMGTIEPPANNEKRETPVSEHTMENVLVKQLELNMRASDAAVLKEDYDAAAAFLQKNEEIQKRLDMVRSSDQPDGVKKAESDDARHDLEEGEHQAEQTEEAQEDIAKAKDAPETLLSGNKIGGSTPSDAKTGSKNDIAVEHHMDVADVQTAKPSAEAEDNVVRDPTVVQMDTEIPGTNQTEQVPLSVEADVMELVSSKDAVDSNTASANAMEAANIPTENMETLTRADERADRQISREREAEAKRVETRQELLEGIQREGGEIKGFHEMVNTLVQAGHGGEGVALGPSAENPDLAKRLKFQKQVLATLRKENKMRDIMTTQAPTAAEQEQLAIVEAGRGIGTGELGGTGVGTPVFAPNQARGTLHRLQIQQVATLTDEEARALRTEMNPLWVEYRRIRVAQGVQEMEAMPTRVITSDRSRTKAAQRVRPDVDQREEGFANFMYWLIHHKWRSGEALTWNKMLLYSAALGYNDLTQAQINWLVTGNPDGNLSEDVDFSGMGSLTEIDLDEPIPLIGDQHISLGELKSLEAQAVGNPEPQVQYPSRNVSPSGAPSDKSRHPDGSTGPERAAKSELEGLPGHVTNIPDPRISRRGGADVPNVRIVTVRNPKFDPSKTPDDDDFEPEFITKEVPDIGAGSKDIQAEITAAEADRLLTTQPTKLYAPIHPQACDRYLGSRNYQRLGLPLDKYLKHYAQQGFGPTDFQKMYEWNLYTMGLFGGYLYAFVTDIQMQRNTPVFDMSTPEAVGDEFMELNELVKEMRAFQQHAEDRADRVVDGGAGARPLEDHLNSFFQNQTLLDKQSIANANAAVISFPSDRFPPSNIPIIPPIAPGPPAPAPDVSPVIPPLEPGPVIPSGPLDPTQNPDAPPLPPVIPGPPAPPAPPAPAGGGDDDDDDILPPLPDPIGPDRPPFPSGDDQINARLFRQARRPTNIKTHREYGPIDMDRGIVNRNAESGHQAYDALPAHIGKRKARHNTVMDEDLARRNKMFQRFMLR